MRSILVLCLTVLTAAVPFTPERDSHIPNHHPKSVWGRYDLDTDYYLHTPDTGVVREYFFDISNTTAAPDGRNRSVLLVNGQFPGPTIEANWGDVIKVHVTNSMTNNGSAIHFHGIRQFWSNQNDGVQSLTQCPIAPGSSYTYTWRATQYGSSWYHSHFSLQAWEGVFGGIIIHGPATADYDEDLGVLFLNDWSETTADAMYQQQLESIGTPQMQGGLINGTNVYQYANGSSVGNRFEATFQKGRKYRIRLVNAAIHSHFKFSIDGHKLLVIATDFVAIQPFETTLLDIGMGQRYDVIVNADRDVDNYWLRAHPQTLCSNNTSGENIKGIISYKGQALNEPTSIAWNITDPSSCVDMDSTLLVPRLSIDVPLSKAHNTSLPVDLEAQGDPSLFLWTVGGHVFNTTWDDPSLLRTLSPSVDWVAQEGAIDISRPDEWIVVIMETQLPVSHPIHLHGSYDDFQRPSGLLLTTVGHDFFILGQGSGSFANSTEPLQTANPPRRDVAQLNASGYLVIAFQADNPGAWLMHCHIGFHATEGFATQFIERKHEIPALVDQHNLRSTCQAWKEYGVHNPAGIQDRFPFGLFDSGV